MTGLIEVTIDSRDLRDCKALVNPDHIVAVTPTLNSDRRPRSRILLVGEGVGRDIVVVEAVDEIAGRLRALYDVEHRA